MRHRLNEDGGLERELNGKYAWMLCPFGSDMVMHCGLWCARARLLENKSMNCFIYINCDGTEYEIEGGGDER